MVFVKSCFNYIGGKFKLLPILYEYFPVKCNVFVDVFGGGFNVGVNSQSEKIVYNDQLSPLVELQEYLYNHSFESVLDYVKFTIEDYGLSKTDKESFNYFRKEYNNSKVKHPLDLYVLMCFSFNYQLRYNNQREYNSSHGTNRSSFNKTTEKRLKEYMGLLQSKNIIFLNKDFMDLDYNQLSSNDFVYFDPPYILGTGNYNDGNRGFKNWSVREEQQLYKLLSWLDECNVCFGLNNLLEHNGKGNRFLKEFLYSHSDFRVVDMNSSYSNSSYQKKDKINKSREVYVTNYSGNVKC